jgi:two-component system CheB/CheR fusion protein
MVEKKKKPKKKKEKGAERRGEVKSGVRKRKQPTFVVGIGASAGGIKALETFFSNVTSDSGMAFVVVQHLDPHHESMMSSLLAKETSLKVHNAQDGMPVEPNQIYLRPPGKNLTIKNQILHLSKVGEKEGARLPIDSFFRSLSEDLKERAIGIVLSGASTDGTLGAKSIKGEGGLVMAQDDQEAQYPTMPKSVIEAGLADVILPTKDMPEELLRYAGHPLMAQEPQIQPEEKLEQTIQRILMLVRTHTGHDFSQYKRNTVRRRIERRMALNQIHEVSDYASYLRQSKEEVTNLFKDLSINVTSFFRDADAFLQLKEKVIQPLLQEKPADSTIRAWVPACCTGEEAYSLAILLVETAEELEKYFRFKIFGTDIYHEAVETARSGLFPANIAADISSERLRRFFSKQGQRYQVDSRIRDMAVFAVHDVTRDPPFSNMDLVSCRNLLIYMDTSLQKKVLPVLHYALKPKGTLFLGTSETVGDRNNLFDTVDKKNKIYRARPAETEHMIRFRMPLIQVHEDEEPEARRPGPEKREQVREVVERAILEKHALPSVLLDEKANILYFHGNTGRFLSLPTGEPNFNIFNMVSGELHFRLSQAREEVKRSKDGVRIKDIQVQHNEDFLNLEVTLSPISLGKKKNWTLMEFKEQEPPQVQEEKGESGQEEEKAPEVTELKYKLKSTQQELQATIEELETSNEELRASNEELQANNEELQSTNEELESSKEELQSTNEELETVNTELSKKNQALMKAEDDLNNLFSSAEVGTIFLDDELRIKRFTPAAKAVFNLKEEADIGRRISDITSNLDYNDWEKDAEEVLDKLTRKEVKAYCKDGKIYIVRISPYRSGENVIEGVVITFLDVSQLEKMDLTARDAQDFFYKTLSALWEPVLILDKDYRVFTANRSFYRTFKSSPKETLNRSIFELGDKQWDIPELRRFLEEIIPADSEFEGYEVDHEFPEIGQKRMLLNARRISEGEERPAMILLSFKELTGKGQP